MTGQSDEGDKSHEATARKLDEARKRGEIPRSADLSAGASFGGLLLVAVALGVSTTDKFASALRSLVDRAPEHADLLFSSTPSSVTGPLIYSVLSAVAPWFTVPAIAVISVISIQRGLVFTPSKLQFKVSRVSPVANAKNKYGRSGMFEFAKSFVKLLVISMCLALFIKANLPEISITIAADPAASSSLMLRLSVKLLAVAWVVAMVVGGIDYVWQRAEHLRKNRMTHKELRDEHKESEGDPHMKQERRSRALDIATNQMMTEVPGCDVVVVNPTHYSVALKWSRLRGEAPICVAKGLDETALRIRRLAEDNGVPVKADPATARALYATVDIGAEIPVEHYQAVAAAIRFAETIRARAKRSWS